MIDKSLVIKRFKKSLKTYDDNAQVQKQTAEKLINLLPRKNFGSIFEAGCSTGILTKEIKKNIQFKEYYSNDIVEEAKYYIDKIIMPNTFICGDIEKITAKKQYDLIISNACLQWCNDIKMVISKLAGETVSGGILAFSIFGDDNLREIKTIFNIENKTYTIPELKDYLKGFEHVLMKEETIKLEFDTFRDILKHLKYTGVNAIKDIKLTKNALKNYETQYKNLYSHNEKLILTYNPVYIIIEKSGIE